MPSISRQWTEETSCFSSVEPQSQPESISTILKFSCMVGTYLYGLGRLMPLTVATFMTSSMITKWSFTLKAIIVLFCHGLGYTCHGLGYTLNLVPSRRVVWFLIMFILIYSAHDIHTGTRNLEEITESLLCWMINRTEWTFLLLKLLSKQQVKSVQCLLWFNLLLCYSWRFYLKCSLRQRHTENYVI